MVNDNVMGGRSEGGFDQEPGRLVFAGRTNTRGGGFSSVRTKPLALDLSEYEGIRVRVKGDGRRYTWRAGFTGFICDARVALEQSSTLAEDTDVGFGYRTIEGGADVDDVFSFAWLNFAFVLVRVGC